MLVHDGEAAAVPYKVPAETMETVEQAAKDGLFRLVEARPGIKLPPTAPKIAVCIPMGAKDCHDVYTDEETGDRFFGEVINPRTQKPVSALRATRSNGLAPVEWLLNAWQITPPLLTTMTVMVRKGVLSAQAREEMTAMARKEGATYIFYWDDDVIIPPKTLLDMHSIMERNPDIGVLSGVYVTREDVCEPLIYKHHGQGAFWNFDPTPGHVEDIFGAGAGCLMARVEALEDVERILGGPFWLDETDFESIEGGARGIMWGHDIRFCRRMWLTHQRFEAGDPQPGPAGIPDPSKDPRKKWRVCVAGWVQCLHFDYREQKIFGLPEDAPCFKDKNRQTYWDYMWEAEGHGTPRVYPELYDRIVSLVPRDSSVVDFGCGIGVLLDRIAKQCHANVFGVDISQRAIEKLTERWMRGAVADVGEGTFQEWTGASADECIAISTETIEHLSNDKLNHLLDQLHPCPLTILSCPEGDLAGTPDGEHVQIWTAESLLERLKPHFKWIRIERLETEARKKNPYLIAVATNNPAMKGTVCPPVESLSGSSPDLQLTGPVQHLRPVQSKSMGSLQTSPIS